MTISRREARESSRHADRSARAICDDGRYGKRVAGRTLRVYESVDARLVFDDMEALLRLQARMRARAPCRRARSAETEDRKCAAGR